MSPVRRRAAAALAALAAPVLISAPALAAEEPTVVGLGPCAVDDGGQAEVPAGTPVELRPFAFAQGTYGLINTFLRKQVTTLLVTDSTGTHQVDLSGTYPAPVRLDKNLWLARPANDDLGTLALGESVTVGMVWDLPTPLLVAYPPVGSSGDNGPYLIHSDGDPTFTCTITGV